MRDPITGEEIFGRGQEFEDRNRQLPGDTGSPVYAGGSIEKVRAELAKTVLGSPPQDCDVRSTFDSRPVNAYDFNLINHQNTPN